MFGRSIFSETRVVPCAPISHDSSFDHDAANVLSASLTALSSRPTTSTSSSQERTNVEDQVSDVSEDSDLATDASLEELPTHPEVQASSEQANLTQDVFRNELRLPTFRTSRELAVNEAPSEHEPELPSLSPRRLAMNTPEDDKNEGEDKDKEEDSRPPTDIAFRTFDAMPAQQVGNVAVQTSGRLRPPYSFTAETSTRMRAPYSIAAQGTRRLFAAVKNIMSRRRGRRAHGRHKAFEGVAGPALWAAENVFSALVNCAFHLVFVAEERVGLPCTLVSSTCDESPRPQDVPASARAIVLLCFSGLQDGTTKLISELVGKGLSHTAPIVVVLMSTHGQEIPRLILRSITRSLISWGVESVVVQRSLGEELVADVNAAVERARASPTFRHPQQRKMVVEAKPDTEGLLPVVWSAVETLFEGLPQMREDLDPKESVGTVIESTQLLRKISCGARGTVFFATTDGIREAAKMVPKSQLNDINRVRGIWNEVCLMKRLSHQNVVRLRNVLHTRHHMILFMEYAGADTLFMHLELRRRLATSQLTDLMIQLVSGIAYCHRQGVAHRDLSLRNIVLWSGGLDGQAWLKIVDFASAADSEETLDDIVGTMPVIAPEVMIGEKYRPNPVDMWACGVILLDMVFGVGMLSRLLGWTSLPVAGPECANELCTFFGGLAGRRREESPLPSSMPSHILEVVLGLFQIDPAKRWSSSDVEASEWLGQDIL
eukprot:TRINITY_DN12860_c0_g1_i2.p1 TRINITY_DN12860_c0_g1~~TRINITY_DN12860_c0_g1_i2.p1  ORF type:complete len:716 (+),score=98.64 TRINITY_DN12860_c0_g1_i2:167-2314(+)